MIRTSSEIKQEMEDLRKVKSTLKSLSSNLSTFSSKLSEISSKLNTAGTSVGEMIQIDNKPADSGKIGEYGAEFGNLSTNASNAKAIVDGQITTINAELDELQALYNQVLAAEEAAEQRTRTATAYANYVASNAVLEPSTSSDTSPTIYDIVRSNSILSRSNTPTALKD